MRRHLALLIRNWSSVLPRKFQSLRNGRLVRCHRVVMSVLGKRGESHTVEAFAMGRLLRIGCGCYRVFIAHFYCEHAFQYLLRTGCGCHRVFIAHFYCEHAFQYATSAPHGSPPAQSCLLLDPTKAASRCSDPPPVRCPCRCGTRDGCQGWYWRGSSCVTCKGGRFAGG